MSKRRWAMFAGMAIIVAGLAGFLIWQWYGGYSEYRAFKDLEKRYVSAMTEDNYGGKTPQETLDMFVSALKAGDVELASKYFMLDDNLSRDKWVKTLQILKEREVLGIMAEDIENKSQADIEGATDENDFKFSIYDRNGKVGAIIDMRLNTYSNVWKIESL